MNKIQITLAMSLIILAGAIPAISQQSTPKTSSVAGSATIRPVSNGESEIPATSATDDELAIANQRLAKALDALEKAERLIAALDAEILARKRLDATNEEILTAKNAVIAEQAKMIELLIKQTGRKVSFLFGLVKVRY